MWIIKAKEQKHWSIIDSSTIRTSRARHNKIRPTRCRQRSVRATSHINTYIARILNKHILSIVICVSFFLNRILFYYILVKNNFRLYRSKLWAHLSFDECLNYLNFNFVSDKIFSLNELNAIKILYKRSPEWSRFVKFWRRYCKKAQISMFP